MLSGLVPRDRLGFQYLLDGSYFGLSQSDQIATAMVHLETCFGRERDVKNNCESQ